jgi:hypothetical protein
VLRTQEARLYAREILAVPFKSKSQWRKFFANPRLRKYAKEWAKKTASYKSLPRRARKRGK